MLRCTPAAARALDEYRDELEVPRSYGLRVFATGGDDGRPGVRMAFVSDPLDGDVVSEDEGQRIFVAPELAPSVTGLELDAEPEASPVGLILRPSDRN